MFPVNAATSKPAPTYPYPYGQSGCTGSVLNCAEYYGDTHFDGQVVWDGVFSDLTKVDILAVKGTYTYSTGNYDTWELERVTIYNGPGGFIAPVVYDSKAYDGKQRRYGNSSHWETYTPAAPIRVDSGNNMIMLYYEIKMYTATGSPSQTFYPKRGSYNITS